MKKNIAEKMQALLCALLLTLFAPFLLSGAGAAEPLRYFALDVGQGDCSLFLLPNGQNIVVDAGTGESAEAVADFLRDCGVKKIDLLVATHPHEDHIGGILTLLNEFPVGKIWDSGYNHGSRLQANYYKAVKEKKIPFGRPKRGFSENFGEVAVKVLAPARLLKKTHSDANNNGIILTVTYGKISFLMMADAEREERNSIPPLPQANILKAAHHGSSNGTDRKLLRQVDPDMVILSYAVGNSYGHPHREVVRLLAKSRALRFDTAEGTVKLKTDGKSIGQERKRVVK